MTKEVHRMKVFVFGCSPSLLMQCVASKEVITEGAQEHGTDAVNLVECHFYVHDGLLFVLTDA